MAIGKSLTKINQGRINALIGFLVWIVFFHSSSCNAFVLGVQVFCSPKTPSKINNALSFGGKSNKSFDNETVSSFQLVVAFVSNKFLKDSTNYSPEKGSPSFKQLPVPNDHNPAFKQLSVSNDGHAITTLSFLHLHVPFRTATHANLLLLPVQDGSAIMMAAQATHTNLSLLSTQDNPAITTAAHEQNLLLYAQIGSAITTATHTQNLLLFFVQNNPANSKLHLIVAFIQRALTFQTTVDLISVSEGEHQVTKLH
jgi:hypothetical protein